MGAVAAVEIDRPRLPRLAAYDIHNAADGIRTVERRTSPLDDLDTLDIVHVQAAVIDIVECFARKPFAVDEEQHRITAESRHVERHLLVHRIGELDTGQLALQQIAYVGRIRSPNVGLRNHTSDDGDIFQQFGRARSGHHYLIHHGRGLDKAEIQFIHSPFHDIFTYRFVSDERDANRIIGIVGEPDLITALLVGRNTQCLLFTYRYGSSGKRLPRSIRNDSRYYILSPRR